MGRVLVSVLIVRDSYGELELFHFGNIVVRKQLGMWMWRPDLSTEWETVESFEEATTRFYDSKQPPPPAVSSVLDRPIVPRAPTRARVIPRNDRVYVFTETPYHEAA